ncbi:putative membrane protein YgcG [Microvirga lupini]|uniref:Putative membrane protein YgcG n=1 Tax=Microvirga lupini TaxID=420324 RepID=A0A7W4VIQ1_9HYPH|nr:hypothetical protein [Microvirga lupini]MBB3017506.1 putative membrane protein YgcG [Microvirga lupini]
MLSRDETLAVVISIATALLVVTFAIIAGAAMEARTPGQDLTPGPSCAEWTNGCVVCRRVPEGLACSTPGIACVPGAQRCLRPAGVPI